MAKPFGIALAILGVLFSAVDADAAATKAPPKVVFIGDYLTAGWTSGFAANPNWINEGTTAGGGLAGQTSDDVVARFQSDVVNLHPAIVHILIGANDAAGADDGTVQLVNSVFINNIVGMVQMARAANIKVILATSPPGSPTTTGLNQMNAFLEAYGTANNIPVVNYADALCNCVNSTAGVGQGGALISPTVGFGFPTPNPSIPGYPGPQPLTATTGVDGAYDIPAPPIPTTAGYALMTQMAQNTIATMSLTLKSGWLGDISYNMGVGVDDLGPETNVNKTSPGTTTQFTAYGLYSDGVRRPMLNSNYAGATGTWTSSNPTVMYVTQTGVAYALAPGHTWIEYISPNGVYFSPWGMTVGYNFPPCCTTIY